MNKLNDKGNRHGPWEEYHENGRLMRKINYVNGDFDGLYESYFENGKVCWKGIFEKFQRIGFWLDGYSNGIILKSFFL